MAGNIMYVCGYCAEHYPEGCGHYERDELFVMPDGTWLCENCADETDTLSECGVVPGGENGDEWPNFRTFSSPPEYGPITQSN
mgnify:FL=1